MSGSESKNWLRFWPEDVPQSIEAEDVTLGEIFDATAKRYPDKTAVIFLGRRYSYGRISAWVDSFATALYEMGVRKGDVVAVRLPNSVHFVVTFFAAMKLGAVITANNPLYKAAEIEHQFCDAGAKVAVVMDIVYEDAGKALPATKIETLIGCNIADFLPAPKRVLGKLLRKIPKAPMPSHTVWFMEMLRTRPNLPDIRLDPNQDLAVLQYTGGTTGLPKGAMLTHKNLVSNAIQTATWDPKIQPGEDVVVGVLPLFHIYAMTTVMNLSVQSGSAMLLFPKLPEWGELLYAIERYQATLFPGVAALYNAINNYENVQDYDLRSIRACISGAGPLPIEVQKRFEQISGARLIEGYGLTECSPVTHVNPIYGRSKIGTIGIPVAGTDAKIMDSETGENVLAPDQIGELVIKGPQVMKGYFNREEENRSVLRDGWLYTGDLATVDEDGYFTIVDRKKDMIKRSGYSVYPREVEDYLYKNDNVMECAVIGIQDDKVGEEIKAFVVLKPQSRGKISEQELIDWAKENMAAFKYPRLIEFRDEIPKGTANKILRRALKEEETRKKSP